MKNHSNRKKTLFFAMTSNLLLLTSTINNSHAEMIQALTGVDINETPLLKDNGIVLGGSANAGITYNATDPEDNFNGTVGLGDRSGEFQLNQLNLFVERAVATEGDDWSFGGRIDVMFGSDAIFYQAFGASIYDINTAQLRKTGAWDLNAIGGEDNRFYDFAFPQAYLEMYAPIGNGIDLKLGHFYTIVGSDPSFFYSFSYTTLYAEPGTHTGLLSSYTFNVNWAVTIGALTGSSTGGWDAAWDQQLGNWAGLGLIKWTSDSKDSIFTASGTYGKTSETSNAAWGFYSLVFEHNITESIYLMLQHDHGFANNTYDYFTYTPNAIDAEWYGINSELRYNIDEDLILGLRGEWFRDQNGFRVVTPVRIFSSLYDSNGTPRTYAGSTPVQFAPASYYEVTLGLNWKPLTWLTVRPNLRYDWVDADSNFKPFDTGNKRDQFLFSTDLIVTF